MYCSSTRDSLRTLCSSTRERKGYLIVRTYITARDNIYNITCQIVRSCVRAHVMVNVLLYQSGLRATRFADRVCSITTPGRVLLLNHYTEIPLQAA